MLTSSGKSNVDNDNLICPITYQIFRDPVIAGDGHTYERTAIVRWIMEHGTSPLTRQPLNINELQADDYLRNLAAQRRCSSISSNYSTNVDQPALQRQNSAMSYNYNIHVNQPVLIQQQQQQKRIQNNSVPSIDSNENVCMPCSGGKRRWAVIISSLFILALTITFVFSIEVLI